MSERRAPVQRFGTIPWSLYLEAYEVYASRYGRDLSAERQAERGGFCPLEMDEFVPGWRDRPGVMEE